MAADPVILVPTARKLKKYGRPGGLYDFITRSSLLDVLRWEDDFLGDTVHGTYATLVDNGGTATLVANITNGLLLLDVVGAADNNYAALYMPNRPCAGELNSVLAVRLTSVTAITDTKIEVGFADDPSVDAGIVNSLAANTFNATNGACWIYDTDDTAYWQAAAVQAGTAITKVEPTSWGSGNAAPVAATYQWLIVALRGTAVNFIALDANGGQIYETGWQASGITAATAVSPWVMVQNRAAAAKSARIDYLGFWQRRTTG